MKRTCFFLFLITCLCRLLEATPYYHFKQLSIRDGLPSTVGCLCQDSKGSLWVGTRYGVYRVKDEKVQKFPLPYELRLRSHSVSHLCTGPAQRIWMITEDGVCYYQPEADSLQVLKRYGERVRARVVLPYRQQLLVPTRDSLLVFDAQLRPLPALPLSRPDLSIYQATPYDAEHFLLSIGAKQLYLLHAETGQIRPAPFQGVGMVFYTFRDRFQRFWVPSYGKGVRCYSAQGDLLQEYTPQNSALTHPVILDIAEWDGALWLATDGGGINILHPETKRIERLKSSQGRRLLAHSVTTLYQTGNHMWIGLVREGVMGVEKSFITTFTQAAPGETDGLSNKCPLCLWEDEDGSLWIGTDGGGINRYQPHTEHFTHYPQTAGEKIVSLCPFSDTELLASSFTKGLFLFNKRTGAYRPFALPWPGYLQFYHAAAPINLRRTRQGDLEMYGNRVLRYRPATHEVTSVHPPLPGLQASWMYIGRYGEKELFYDRKHVFLYHEGKGHYEFLTSPQHSGQLFAAALDARGYLWLADATGLRRITLKNRHTEMVRLPDAQELVTSLAVDHQGTVWMGTLGGIYSYDPRRRHFRMYNEINGVVPNDFLPKAVWVNRQGHVYMGGSEGLACIYPQLQAEVPQRPLQLKLQDVQLNGHYVHLKPQEEFQVPYSFETLQLQVYVADGNSLHKRLYRFRVKGLNDGYIETSRPQLTLSTLTPGHYTVTVQCMENSGWNREVELLRFTVLPPWWLRGWFLMFCLLLLLVLLVYGARVYDRRLQLHYSEQERTLYKEKVKALININHELRTPLTLIYGPLKQLAANTHIPFTERTRLYQVLKQARQMKNLIDMILNMRKMEMDRNILRMSSTPLNDWLQQVVDDFKDEFAQRDITLLLQPDARIETLYFDRNQCEIILHNLLMNAYKFSEDHTQVVVSTQLTAEGRTVRIEVSDQGCGLQPEDFKHLFTRFYQGRHGFQGTGVGLSYAKQLVEMHGGVIGAQNNADQGATFFFTLPYRKQAADIENVPRPYLQTFEDGPDSFQATVSAPRPETSPAMKFHSILLVEADRDLCDYLTCNLQSCFEQVYQAHDGKEALPLLHAKQPQMVLSSIKLPRMSGLELCKYMKQKSDLSYIPVVFLTSIVEESVLEEAYKAGAEAFITKPFDMDLLLIQLQNILHSHKVVKEHFAPVTSQEIAERVSLSRPDELLLAQIHRIVRDNLSDSTFNATTVADQLGMSRATLYNKTRDLMPIGISEYIAQCRLLLATQLLDTTSLTINEIAEKAGFKHARNFSTLFKQATGQTPTEYRKRPTS